MSKANHGELLLFDRDGETQAGSIPKLQEYKDKKELREILSLNKIKN